MDRIARTILHGILRGLVTNADAAARLARPVKRSDKVTRAEISGLFAEDLNSRPQSFRNRTNHA